MKDLLLSLLHPAVRAAKLCGHGGVRALIAENLLLRPQLIVVGRGRKRAPNLTWSDRLLCGFGALFLSPGRIRTVAIVLRPSTRLAFHQALVRRTYHRLFSSTASPKKPGPRLIGRPHAADVRRRTRRGPCRSESCAVGLPLPRPCAAPGRRLKGEFETDTSGTSL